MLNFPIIELAFVHQVFYSGDADIQKNSHYVVSYLLDINGKETVCEIYPSSLDAVLSLPLVTKDTPIQYVWDNGQPRKV